jgi:hypothetical protein
MVPKPRCCQGEQGQPAAGIGITRGRKGQVAAADEENQEIFIQSFELMSLFFDLALGFDSKQGMEVRMASGKELNEWDVGFWEDGWNGLGGPAAAANQPTSSPLLLLTVSHRPPAFAQLWRMEGRRRRCAMQVNE